MFVVLFEDSAAMLGLVAAFFGIYLSQVTGSPYFDGAASIVIGLILAGTAIWLAHETHGLLLGEVANPEDANQIRSILDSYDSIKSVNEIATMHMGPEYILVTLSVDFESGISSDDVEAAVRDLDQQIKQANPRVKRVFIEAEAMRPRVDAAPTQITPSS